GGGLSFGVSVDADYAIGNGSTHSISYSTQSIFESVVGDIDSPEDYEDWRYTWGFSVETVGRRADSNNNPTGYDSSKHNYQLLRYWVDRTGSQY
ncbi:MAG: hypothetical protein P1V35_02555, partial [Planctomycetota bacterium]|nr:hypothetical protein [Planctomycetota bacterium]